MEGSSSLVLNSMEEMKTGCELEEDWEALSICCGGSVALIPASIIPGPISNTTPPPWVIINCFCLSPTRPPDHRLFIVFEGESLLNSPLCPQGQSLLHS